MTQPIRIGIVDDQELVRLGLRLVLAAEDELEVVAEAPDGDGAIALARRDDIDVLLMDVRMPGIDGITATEQIAAQAATPRIIVLTTFDLDEYAFAALRAGASGFLLKDAGPEQLLDAIRVVARGEALLAPSITRRLVETYVRRGAAGQPDPRLVEALTDREREVLALVARGLSNTEAAARLFVSPATVKTHVSRILGKLDARDRAQLVVVAYEAGLVVPGLGDPA